jgi:uncharacterized protein
MAANLFSHLELNTGDAKTAKAFYKKLFPSWKLSDMPSGDGGVYTMIDVKARGSARAGAAGGGVQQKPTPDVPTGWTPYVLVDDVAESVARAVQLGATVAYPVTDMGMGLIAVVTDPSGAPCGLWTPAAPPRKKPAKKKKAATRKKTPARKASRRKR